MQAILTRPVLSCVPVYVSSWPPYSSMFSWLLVWTIVPTEGNCIHTWNPVHCPWETLFWRCPPKRYCLAHAFSSFYYMPHVCQSVCWMMDWKCSQSRRNPRRWQGKGGHPLLNQGEKLWKRADSEWPLNSDCKAPELLGVSAFVQASLSVKGYGCPT